MITHLFCTTTRATICYIYVLKPKWHMHIFATAVSAVGMLPTISFYFLRFTDAADLFDGFPNVEKYNSF